jgi:hypothetical protein
MNDKDKEAFEEWYMNNESVFDDCKEAWQAACEYMQAELAHHIFKIEAENKKLREALEFYANTFTWQGHYDVHNTPALILTDRDNESCVFGNRAREALKKDEGT